MVMLIIGTASAFGWLMVLLQVPAQTVALMRGLTEDPVHRTDRGDPQGWHGHRGSPLDPRGLDPRVAMTTAIPTARLTTRPAAR